MLRKLFQKKKATTKVPGDLLPPELDLNQEDKEEDGFLVVGETLSERQAVTPEKYSAYQTYKDLPPTYESLCQSCDMGNQQSAATAQVTPATPDKISDDELLDVSQENQSSTPVEQIHVPTPVTDSSIGSVNNVALSGATAKPSCAYDDIPFKLSPELVASAMSHHMQEESEYLRKLQPSNLDKYHYEFTLERTVMQNSG